MLLPLLLCLPWVALLALAARIRFPPVLPEEPRPSSAPLVSVVVPARNEAVNIVGCLESLVASRYPAFEVIVVDDRSGDETAALARALPAGNARRLEVVEGAPLPEGWFGKPWACRQGAERARGDLLLFTDADTVHGPDLLERAVEALRTHAADSVSLVGRQIMETFWEKVVQPHFFAGIAFRFPDLRRPLPPGRWRDAIANGQFILVRRDAYESIGGHEAVRGEVVEDLRLAQILVRSGKRLQLFEAQGAFATRMYRSLGGILEGWTKNLATAVRQTFPGRHHLILPAAAVLGIVMWVVPPLSLGMAALGAGGPGLRLWAALATGMSALFWSAATARMGLSPLWGLLYPLGGAVSMYIVVRSWIRGRTIEWKGRVYGR